MEKLKKSNIIKQRINQHNSEYETITITTNKKAIMEIETENELRKIKTKSRFRRG